VLRLDVFVVCDVPFDEDEVLNEAELEEVLLRRDYLFRNLLKDRAVLRSCAGYGLRRDLETSSLTYSRGGKMIRLKSSKLKSWVILI